MPPDPPAAPAAAAPAAGAAPPTAPASCNGAPATAPPENRLPRPPKMLPPAAFPPPRSPEKRPPRRPLDPPPPAAPHRPPPPPLAPPVRINSKLFSALLAAIFAISANIDSAIFENAVRSDSVPLSSGPIWLSIAELSGLKKLSHALADSSAAFAWASASCARDLGERVLLLLHDCDFLLRGQRGRGERLIGRGLDRGLFRFNAALVSAAHWPQLILCCLTRSLSVSSSVLAA